MALIHCPECGKEVSDQARTCPNCGYPIRKDEGDRGDIQYKVGIMRKVYRKQADRWLFEVNKNENYIGGADFKEGDPLILLDGEGYELIRCFLNTYFALANLPVITFGFDGLSGEIAQRAEYIVKTQKAFAANQIKNEVICPKCGSSQIQIVQRKFSIWTGFMTNKVDRVCANCMYKF